MAETPLELNAVEQMNVWAFLRALSIRDARQRFTNSLYDD
jgi:hypothetical protein